MCLKSSSEKNQSDEKPNEDGFVRESADFQTAIAATRFGKFNILLLLVCVPSTWVSQFESNIMSFIIPAAACDLNLTLSQKSLMNSMSFIGMILSGFCWGFLLDTLGRRKMIVAANLVEFVLVVFTSFAQNFQQLIFLKFAGGIVTGGIYVALNTYIQEFHETKYRGRIQMVFASMYCIANILMPFLASVFLPLKFYVKILNIFDYHGWNLYILASSLSSVVSFTGFYFLPESPKFLVSAGKNDEAMEVLQQVYSVNTGQPKAAYPILKLLEEVTEQTENTKTRSLMGYLKIGWQQISPLFGKPYFPKLVLVGLLQATLQTAMNSLRMYLPQIFQATHDFQVRTNTSNPELCSVLGELRHRRENGDEILCSVNLEDNFKVYLNSMIIAVVTMGAYVLGGVLINMFGKRKLLNVLGSTAVTSAVGLYFSRNPITTIALCSTYLSSVNVCYDIIVMIVVVLFPTTLRAMAFSLNLMLGRSLTVLGNMLIPMLVEIGCAPPIFTLAGLILFALLLSCLVPNTENADLK